MDDIDPSTLLEWLGTPGDMQLVAIEQLCMMLLLSDNVDRVFDRCVCLCCFCVYVCVFFVFSFCCVAFLFSCDSWGRTIEAFMHTYTRHSHIHLTHGILSLFFFFRPPQIQKLSVFFSYLLIYFSYVVVFRCPPRNFLPILCKIIADEAASPTVIEATLRAITFYLDVSAECVQRVVSVEGTLQAICRRLEADLAPDSRLEIAMQCVKVCMRIGGSSGVCVSVVCVCV